MMHDDGHFFSALLEFEKISAVQNRKKVGEYAPSFVITFSEKSTFTVYPTRFCGKRKS